MRWLAFLLLLALPAGAQETLVGGLSQNQISIDTDFDGSELFIYGAVKGAEDVPGGELDVIVQVIGPSTPVHVHKKQRRFGIWINDAGVRVDAAPSFYAIAMTRPFREVISYTEDQRYMVGLDHAVRLIDDVANGEYPEEYRRAVIRLNRAKGLYLELPEGVVLEDETLFVTRIRLPAQLVEGDYRVRFLLLRDKRVIDSLEKRIDVRKVGLERLIYTTAKERPALYGMLSIFFALAAGWLASAAFRVLFP